MGKIIVIIVALVVVVGGAAYFMSKSTAGTAPVAATTQQTAENTSSSTADQGALQAPAPSAGASSGSGTIGSLMAMTGSAQCTVNVAGANPASGMIYVSAGKMHGNFTMTMQGKTMHAYMINDGAYLYSWSDMTPEGIKVQASAAASSGASAHGFSPSTAVSYSCSPWAADPSEFIPPASVTFMAVGGR